MRRFLLLAVALIIVIISGFYLYQNQKHSSLTPEQNQGGLESSLPTNRLMIEEMRKADYPGSDLTLEQTLTPGSNYNRYIASYKSEGLKIYGLLSVPTTPRPQDGCPAIIFNHGYIPPEEYRTTEKYVAYFDNFARNGYVVFKSDYRGNGNSEGFPEGAYYSPAYTIDVLNALSSLRKYTDVNPQKIGMWGHSLGGNITLRSMVITRDIKAGIIWGGVVGTYDETINNWMRRNGWRPSQREQDPRRQTRQQFIDKYQQPKEGSQFWQKIDPRSYLKDISAPIQIHHGTADETVPILFSQNLKKSLDDLGKVSEFYSYNGADHNLSSPAFELAAKRSVDFFDKYLK